MLESLGYAEAGARADADLILFNTCSIREKADNRLVGHLGEAKRLKSEDPGRVVGIGGCWSQSLKDQVFEMFPFVDVAFGPGQVHRLAEFLTSDSLSAQGYFEFEGFTGHLPMKRAREHQAWVQISVGCNCACSYCIVPSTRGREVSRPAAELVAECERLAADGVREVTLLGQNVCSYGRDLPRGAKTTFAELLSMVDAIDGLERIRYTSPHPKDIREDVIRAHAELAERVRAHPPAAPVGLLARAQGDAPHLQPRALPRPRGDDPRAGARLRDHHGHHRRLPGGDRRGVRGDDGGGRAGALRLGLHVHLLAPPRHARRGARGRAAERGQERAHGAPGRRGPAPRRRARPALRGADDGGARRGPVTHGPGAPARANPPQQDRALRGRGGARRADGRPDRRGDEHDAGGRRAAAGPPGLREPVAP